MNLIIGGDSFIGSALSAYWRQKNIPFHASTRHEEKVAYNRPLIDLNKTDTFQHLKNYKSTIICAAITDISECEKNPYRTRKVNVVGTVELAKRFAEKGIHVVFLSSNQVFNGQHPMQKPDAARNPINEYGRQKAEVEMFIETLPNACILRITKVIHHDLPLMENWLAMLSNGDSVFVFADMTLSPINLDDVINKIDLLVKDKAKGIYQLSGEEDISYYEFAQAFAKENGFSERLVKEDSWKNKLQFTPSMYTSLTNV